MASIDDLQKQLKEAKEDYSEMQSGLRDSIKNAQNIVQNMFKQSFGDPSATQKYTAETSKTFDLVNRQLKLQKEIIEKLVKTNKDALQEKLKEIKSIEKEIEKREKLNKTIEKSADGITKLFSGDLKGGLTSFISGLKGAGVILAGLKIAGAAFEAQARNNLLSAQIGGGFNNPNIATGFRLSLGRYTSLDNANVENYANYVSQNFNTVGSPERANQLASMRAQASNYFQGRVSQGTLDALLPSAIRRGQVQNLGMAGQLVQYIEQGAQKTGVSQDRFVKNLGAVNDAVAQYEVDIEKVGGLLSKFGKEVDKGTISLQQLVAVQNAIAGGSTEQNAGLGALLLQSGRLPADAMKYAGNPLALAGWMRANAFRSDVVKGVEGQVRNEAYSMGLNDPLARSEYFRMRYQSWGYNISNEQAKQLGQGGSLSAKDWEKIQAEGIANAEARETLASKAQEFFVETTTPLKLIENIYLLLKDHFGDKGVSDIEQNFMKFDTKGRVGVGGYLGYVATKAIASMPQFGLLVQALGTLEATLRDTTDKDVAATNDFIKTVQERQNQNKNTNGNGAAVAINTQTGG